jgi:D-xylose transport system ATP-binding protein
VRRLADHGLGVCLISHNLNDVFQVADEIAVLYLGNLVETVATKDVTSNQVVELITSGQATGRAKGRSTSGPAVTDGADS